MYAVAFAEEILFKNMFVVIVIATVRYWNLNSVVPLRYLYKSSRFLR